MKFPSCLPLLALLAVAGATTAHGAPSAAPSVITLNPAQRDVLATAFLYPFLTDAEIEYRASDTEARVRTGGGATYFRYPGISSVKVDGKAVTGTPLPDNLLRVDLPAGSYDIVIVTGGVTARQPGSIPVSEESVATPEAFNERAKTLKAGDTLVVRDGIYSDWQVAVSAQGTPDKPIVIRPQTPGGVIFRRATRIVIGGRSVVLRGFRFEHCGPSTVVRVADAVECRVTQCHFFMCGNPASTFGSIAQVDMRTSKCRVDHCFFTGSKTLNLQHRVAGPDGVGVDNLFDHNIFRDIYRYWINGQENIQIGSNQRGITGATRPRLTVEYNLFDHAWGDGEIISNKSSGNTIRYNVGAHCQNSAVTIRGGEDVTFTGNVLWNNQYALRVMGRRHRITNNLFLPHPERGILFETGSTPEDQQVAADDTLVANNTFISTGGAVAGMAPTESRPHLATRVTVENNTFVDTGSTPVDTRYLPEAIVRNNRTLPSAETLTAPAPNMPPLPPRPLLAPGLYADAELWRQDAEQSISDASDTPTTPLPNDFYLEWEYRPQTYTSAATLRFADYALSWGGADTNGKPRSRMELRRAGSEEVYADAADPINHYMSYQYQAWIGMTPNTRTEPDPAQWYRYTLIRSGGRLMVLVGDARRTGPGIPILLQEERGASTGESRLIIAQAGTGSWRNIRLYRAKYRGDVVPPAPASLTATSRGGGRVTLRWNPVLGATYEIVRNGTERIVSGLAAGIWEDLDVKPDAAYRYGVRAVNPLGLSSPESTVTARTAAGGENGSFYRILRPADAKLTLPMNRNTLAGREHITVDPSAGSAMSGPPDEGSAELTFRVDKEGDYVLWGLVMTPDEGSDSFYTALDDAPYKVWYTGVHTGWEWARIATQKLSAGQHVLKIKHREPRARLSVVLVTDDAGFGSEGK